MECIINADKNILNILGKARTSASNYRLMKYCVPLEIEEGMLVFNVLTREMILLTREEYAERMELDYLKSHWFLVPEELNEKEYAGLVRWTLQHISRRGKNITKYTILTTTDCNARCYYCYEQGCKKVTMTKETAGRVVDFIKENCGNQPVRINWFGGEPLMNASAIDWILEKLKQDKIEYQCSMISNAYLFQDEMIQRAVEFWNLRYVQVTLDGTEEVYNCSKAYVCGKDSAYQVVLSNVKKLLNAGIRVSIRLNLDMTNAENLFLLVDELKEKFEGQKGLTAYAHLIFDKDKEITEIYSKAELEQLYQVLVCLEKKLNACGFLNDDKEKIARRLKVTHCMADNDETVLITPEGYLGMCEHYPDSERMGHIDFPEWDSAVVESWKELKEEIKECEDCFYYPDCVRLKKCTGYGECFALERERIYGKTVKAMKNEYLVCKNKMQKNEAGD